MFKLALTLAALTGVAILSTAPANARSRVDACEDVSTWSVCQGTPSGGGTYRYVRPPKPPGGPGHHPQGPAPMAGPTPEGSGAVAGGGSGGGGGGGGR